MEQQVTPVPDEFQMGEEERKRLDELALPTFTEQPDDAVHTAHVDDQLSRLMQQLDMPAVEDVGEPIELTGDLGQMYRALIRQARNRQLRALQEGARSVVDQQITLDEYQHEVMTTAIHLPDQQSRMMKGALGLASEAGEVAGLMEKHFYQKHELDMDHLIKELGDVAWYLTYFCTAIDTSLAEVMRRNVIKLRARYQEGGFDAKLSENRAEDDI